MKKMDYITPETEVIALRLSDSVLEVGDLFTGSAGEDSHEWWVGGKEGGDFEEEALGSSDIQYDGPNNNLWNDDED